MVKLKMLTKNSYYRNAKTGNVTQRTSSQGAPKTGNWSKINKNKFKTINIKKLNKQNK